MQVRRSTAMLAGMLLLAVPVTASCGMSGLDAATNRDYTPAAGANDRDASVDVLGAVVVSAQKGSGTFLATFVFAASWFRKQSLRMDQETGDSLVRRMLMNYRRSALFLVFFAVFSSSPRR